MIALPDKMALFADAHGHTELLNKALKVCMQEQVADVVLLGDLVDRTDQADACAALMADWRVHGVWGNHEYEIINALTLGEDLGLHPRTVAMFLKLDEVITLDDICFCHDEPPAVQRNPMEQFFNRQAQPAVSPYHIVFSGHTHFRHVRDERGPLDPSGGSIKINPLRRYSINPGALTAGQFAIWDRVARIVRFYTVRPS